MNRRAAAVAASLLMTAAVACLADPALDIAVPFIAELEGWRGEAYCDTSGNATIGHGRLLAHNCDNLGQYWPETRDESREWLEARVKAVLDDVRHHLRVPVSPGAEAALTSLAFNVGMHALVEDGHLLLMINSGEPRGVIVGEWVTWDKEHRGGRLVRSDGLSERRALEVLLYLGG